MVQTLPLVRSVRSDLIEIVINALTLQEHHEDLGDYGKPLCEIPMLFKSE